MRWKPWCANTWATPTHSTCRWRCRWGTAAAGTPRRTECLLYMQAYIIVGLEQEVPVAEHPFDEAIWLQPVEDGVHRGQTNANWANMVGPFGGMTAALLLRAIELHPERAGAPLALTVNFAAPIADGDFDVTARCVRTNRSNQHWFVEL